jgi:hypothetical protein
MVVQIEVKFPDETRPEDRPSLMVRALEYTRNTFRSMGVVYSDDAWISDVSKVGKGPIVRVSARKGDE